MSKTVEIRDRHVHESLSGYLDGELTQQQRQRVETHLEACASCSKDLEELAALRRRLGQAELSTVGRDHWREAVGDAPARLSAGIGWLLLVGGLLLLAGYGIYEFVIDTTIGTAFKLIVAAVYLGLAGLFAAVLRQRLLERKTDKYKDVEI
jgi:anti-sigma factor RsiW